jgi:hypothetical protein
MSLSQRPDRYHAAEIIRLTEILEISNSSEVLDFGRHSGRGDISILCDQVRHETSNVRCCHGCSTQNCLCLLTSVQDITIRIPRKEDDGERRFGKWNTYVGEPRRCASDVHTRRKDVDDGPIVGEPGSGVCDVGCADGDCTWCACGGPVACVVVFVAGCCGDVDALGDKLGG